MTKMLLRPPILFLGAGASAAAFSPASGTCHIPTVMQFFGKVNFPQGQDGRGFETACQRLAWEIDMAERTSENKNWPVYDAEKLLGYLEALVTVQKYHDQPLSIRITRTQLRDDSPGVAVCDLLDFLKKEIVRIYGRDYPLIVEQSYLELFKLLDQQTARDQPIQVFTTNYDSVIESQIGNARFSGDAFNGRPRLSTGFKPGNPRKWDPRTFDESPTSGERVIQLFKLHGSVTWKWDSSSGTRLPVDTGWREPTGDKDCLIYFGYKSVPEADPFKTLHDRLKDTLLVAHMVVAIGFRFFDPYIRETFDMALRANRQLRVLCCLKDNPGPQTPLGELVQAFQDRVELLRDSCGNPVAFGQNGFLQVLATALQP